MNTRIRAARDHRTVLPSLKQVSSEPMQEVPQPAVAVKRQCRTTICREGWYYLSVLALVFGTALSRDVNLLLILAGIMAGPVVFGAWVTAFTLRRLWVHRRAPQSVCAGDLLVVQLGIRNGRRRWGSWAVEVEDELALEAPAASGRPNQTPALCPAVLFPYVAAGTMQTGAYRGRITQRGRYRLGPLLVSTRFPFGLMKRTLRIEQDYTLTVLPRLGRLTRRWVRRHQPSFTGTHRRERRRGGDGDFYGLHPWQWGDSQRAVHWRTSARLGQLVVRQLEQPRSRDLAVLVDLWQPQWPNEEQLDHVELAVSFAATLVADLCRQGGSHLHVAVTNSQPPWIAGPASALLLHDVMHQLAVAQASSEDQLEEWLEGALAPVDTSMEIVLISSRAVDLNDTARFARLWSDPARRGRLGRIRCFDTSSTQLGEYFQPE